MFDQSMYGKTVVRRKSENMHFKLICNNLPYSDCTMHRE